MSKFSIILISQGGLDFNHPSPLFCHPPPAELRRHEGSHARPYTPDVTVPPEADDKRVETDHHIRSPALND